MLKKVTIYIDPEYRGLPTGKEWDDKFIQEIIDTELDSLSGFGYVQGYTIEDITKDGPRD